MSSPTNLLTTPLSPPRTMSRPSSRTSVRSGRSHSPSVSLDDPVALRQHMSSLRHSIRQQQAQLQRLENEVLKGPRPLPPGIMGSPPVSPADLDPPSPYPPSTSSSSWIHMRKSSHEALSELAGSDSNIPLPRRDGTPSLHADGIPEGKPMEFSVGSLPNQSLSVRRQSSPTRSLSRIPVSSVGNARALADEGQPHFSAPHSPNGLPPPIDSAAANSLGPSVSQASISPGKRYYSLATGGTTKVLADLQAGVTSTRNALENTKQQLRQSQRQVAQLTRQTEDLKEGRERLRLEIDGLNAVVTRKERMLQEAIERARKAEAEAISLKSQLKTEVTGSKKSLREMEATVSECTAVSQRSNREYVTLRDSIKGMVDGWKSDMDSLREEMRKREERWRKEAEDVGKKYRTLVDELRAAEKAKENVNDLRAEDERVRKSIEDDFREEIRTLKEEVERSSKESDESSRVAKELAGELARLRRLMQNSAPSSEPS
ncbi:hypothetical protein NEOLEDRAFT_1076403 [Neolentinus lepideus HHB14362 ss-1]|uniref:SWI5-dependent HO expression protein 3 n=1 Tax=Neolentinus lepideus HHB14362 ss-1 TaxID=1314782 RepID=A0A165NU62_9AGAM|nr:hypothetical protein NEOLEDRAFT_1076403 [Neolentinus lepideus HHB14362 ss-1]